MRQQRYKRRQPEYLGESFSRMIKSLGLFSLEKKMEMYKMSI